jgi:hypothetical protein
VRRFRAQEEAKEEPVKKRMAVHEQELIGET